MSLKQFHGHLKGSRSRPSPSRQKLIPKPCLPRMFRALCIPTLRDRRVQCAVKNILKSIFEAAVGYMRYEFKPGRGYHRDLKHVGSVSVRG